MARARPFNFNKFSPRPRCWYREITTPFDIIVKRGLRKKLNLGCILRNKRRVVTLLYVVMEREIHRLPESYSAPGAKAVRDLLQLGEISRVQSIIIKVLNLETFKCHRGCASAIDINQSLLCLSVDVQLSDGDERTPRIRASISRSIYR